MYLYFNLYSPLKKYFCNLISFLFLPASAWCVASHSRISPVVATHRCTNKHRCRHNPNSCTQHSSVMNHTYLFLTLHNRCFIFCDFHKQTICHIPHVRKHFVFYHSEFHSKAVHFLRSRTKFRTRVNRERMRGHPFSISLVRGNRRGGAAARRMSAARRAMRMRPGPHRATFRNFFCFPVFRDVCFLNVLQNMLYHLSNVETLSHLFAPNCRRCREVKLGSIGGFCVIVPTYQERKVITPRDVEQRI